MKIEATKTIDTRATPVILLHHLAIVTVFNIVAAAFVTYVMHYGHGFGESLVFSLCTGTIAFLFIDGGRLALWGRTMPPKFPFIGLVVLAMPLAKFLGNALASRLLGLDPDKVYAYQAANNVTGMIIVTVLACAIITWFFWTRGEVAMLKASFEAEQARAAAIEKQAMQAQLQMLQAQIEPHMLFNTLATLQALIAMDPPRAQHMLDQLIQYLRSTLSSSRSEKTSLEQEFGLLDAYLGLMKVRMGSRLSFALHLPEDLARVQIPPMLLQPLVENAIKHGVEPKVDGGQIDIRAVRAGDVLRLTVTDTGLGLEGAKSKTSGTHVGVSNIRERLQVLYGNRASFTLTSNTPNGVIAQLTIPL